MTHLVVPAAVPRAVVLCVARTEPAPAPVIPVQPTPVPHAHPVALQTARADAETVLLLQAEVDRLRAQLAG
ncbi:MAG: hypothetical protein JWN77_246 [Frankiales bacterium]|nr:hypothetical protein [Frankiales bacterium]